MRWTTAEDATLRELYPTTRNGELADILNARHGNGRRADGVNQHARKLGLRKAEGHRHPMPPKFWTPEREAWLRAFTPGHSERETVDAFEREFGEPVTLVSVKNAKARFGLRSGTVGGRFERGMEPWNKGKTWDEFMSPQGQAASRRTQFKKGEVNGRAESLMKPVGAERVSKDGYVEVKVSCGLQGKPNGNFRFKHHIVWEQANGQPVPPNTMIVFADRDKRNFDPDNLVAVPRGVWAVISRQRHRFHDRESLEACMALARLQHECHALQCSPRACGKCGSTFKPRYAHQRTCDACLGRGK